MLFEKNRVKRRWEFVIAGREWMFEREVYVFEELLNNFMVGVFVRIIRNVFLVCARAGLHFFSSLTYTQKHTKTYSQSKT